VKNIEQARQLLLVISPKEKSEIRKLAIA